MTQADRPIRVIKLGGSLRRYENLPAAFWAWLEQQPPAANVVIPGGGDLTDCIRRADAKFNLGEEESHWICVELLGAAAILTQQILSTAAKAPSTDIISNYESLISLLQKDALTKTIIFDPREFLYSREPNLPGEMLGQNWSITSDSIAARLAEVLGGGELVLLKSALPEAKQQSLEAASATEYVDSYFRRAASRLEKIRCVNLRDAEFSEAYLI